jgi:hypothetical protein
MTETERDLRERWRPSADQIAQGQRLAGQTAAQFGLPERDVWVAMPLVLLNKREDWWTTDVVVETAEGAWAGYTGAGEPPEGLLDAHDATAKAARAALAALGERDGMPSYATVEADGHWATWEAGWLVRLLEQEAESAADS